MLDEKQAVQKQKENKLFLQKAQSFLAGTRSV